MSDEKDQPKDQAGVPAVEQPTTDGRAAADHARQLHIQGLQTELAVIELRARQLGLGEVAHFAGVAAAAASDLVQSRRRRSRQR
jgi:hypothetical protein